MSISKKEREKKMETLVLIVVGRKYKVYRERKYPNGYSRQLVATFKSSYAAELFMNTYVMWGGWRGGKKFLQSFQYH